MSEPDFTGAPSTQLSLARYYNSQDPTSSPYGIGWRSTWDRTLLGATSGSSIVTAERADGREEIFSFNGSTYVADSDVLDALSAVTSGGSQNGWQLVTADDSQENYNLNGQLTSVVTRAGLETNLSYSTTTSQLMSIVGPFGQALSYTYTGNGNVYQVKLPDTRLVTYAYDSKNNLLSATYPDSTKRQYTYGNANFPHLITALTDEDNNTYATWTYDSSGRVINNYLSGLVNSTTVSYNGDGTSTLTSPLGYTTTYNFTTENNAIKPSSLSGAPIKAVGGEAFTYDGSGFVASTEDWNGNFIDYTHDARGNELTRTEAYGTGLARTTTTTWSGTFHLPTKIQEPLSRTTTFSYDAHGNMTGKTLTDGTHTRTWKYTYNSNGQVLGVTDPLSNTTSLSYTTSGNLATIKNALSQVTTFSSYDADGRVLSMTDANALTTTTSYDLRGRLLYRNVGSEQTSYTYDNAGNLTKITFPDSSYISLTYDAAHRIMKLADALGNTTTFTRDAVSNITAIKVYNTTPTLKQTQSYTYDSVNNLKTVIGALSQVTTYGYDTNSNLIFATDPLNHTTTSYYDALNRVGYTLDPGAGMTNYNYDANNQLTSVVDPLNLTTTYNYTGIGDLSSLVSPDTGTTSNTYDAAGNVKTSVDALSHTTSYGYDALNRLTNVKYADATTATLTYDQGTYGKGHLTTLTDVSGTTTWIYDQHGRVTSKSDAVGSLHLTTTYGYDSFGRLQTLTYPSGRAITRSFDSDGRVTKLAEGTATVIGNITYNPFGPATGWIEGNGLTYSRTIDQDGRISNIALSSTTSMTYTIDNANRITALGQTGTGFTNKIYGYNSRDMLTTYFSGTATTSYAYDGDGNRDTSTTLSVTTTYHYPATSNRLSSLFNGTTTTSYTYDADGHLLYDGTNRWTYDDRGRMATAFAGTTTTTYGVNALGERVSKSGTGVSTGENEYVYDEAGHLLGEYDDAGNIIEESVYVGDLPVAELRGTGVSAATYYISPDHLGAPHVITNSSSGVVWLWNPSAFGDAGPNQNPAGLGTHTYNLRFPGQYADAETGISYNMNRDYIPGIGRYAQSDPAGLWGGINTYGYGSANPLTKTDPTGRNPVPLTISCADNPLACAVFAAATASLCIYAARNLGLTLQDLPSVYNMGGNSDDTGSKAGPTAPIPDAASTPPDGPDEIPPAGDLKLASMRDLQKAAQEDGFSDVEDWKQQELQLNARSDIFKDKAGNLYSIPKRGAGEPQPLNVKIPK